MKLTKREKVLLYGLMCFLLVIGGLYLLIFPALDDRQELNTKRSEVQITEQKLRTTLAQYGNLDEAIKETEASIQKIRTQFQSRQEKEDIDELLTRKMIAYQLTALSLEMGDVEEVSLPMYGEELVEGQDLIKAQTVRITFAGTSANMAKFMDEINELPGYKISELHFDLEAENEPITLSFHLYYLE